MLSDHHTLNSNKNSKPTFKALQNKKSEKPKKEVKSCKCVQTTTIHKTSTNSPVLVAG